MPNGWKGVGGVGGGAGAKAEGWSRWLPNARDRKWGTISYLDLSSMAKTAAEEFHDEELDDGWAHLMRRLLAHNSHLHFNSVLKTWYTWALLVSPGPKGFPDNLEIFHNIIKSTNDLNFFGKWSKKQVLVFGLVLSKYAKQIWKTCCQLANQVFMPFYVNRLQKTAE